MQYPEITTKSSHPLYGCSLIIVCNNIHTDVKDKDDQTPVHLASKNGKKDILVYLVEEMKCDIGELLYMQSLLNLYKIVIKIFHTDVKNDMGQSPLDLALKPDKFQRDSVEAAYYLISRGFGESEDKAKLLCEACHWGFVDMVKEIVEHHGIDPQCEQHDFMLVLWFSLYLN